MVVLGLLLVVTALGPRTGLREGRGDDPSAAAVAFHPAAVPRSACPALFGASLAVASPGLDLLSPEARSSCSTIPAGSISPSGPAPGSRPARLVRASGSVPSPPRNLVATIENGSSVALDWTAPAFTGTATPGQLLYTVYLEELNLTAFQPVGRTQQLNWTWAGVVMGQAYRAEVTASNGVGPSAPSAPAAFMVNNSGSSSSYGELGVVVSIVLLVVGIVASGSALAIVRTRRGPSFSANPSVALPRAGPAVARADIRPPLPRSNRPGPAGGDAAPWDEQ